MLAFIEPGQIVESADDCSQKKRGIVETLEFCIYSIDLRQTGSWACLEPFGVSHAENL
jgi:hypothetical protein